MRKGAVDFLEKPIDDETLLSSIARGADLSRKRRAAHLQHNELEKRYVAILPGAIIGLSAADKKPAFSLLWVTTLPGLTSAPTTRESCPIRPRTSMALLTAMALVRDHGTRDTMSAIMRQQVSKNGAEGGT